MAGEVSKAIPAKELWEGGRSPFSMSYGKLMMWLFLISDALTFGAFIVSLGWFRYVYPDWPVSDQVFFHIPLVHGNFPLAYVAFMTFVLIISSVTMVLAVEAGHRNDKAGVVKWMIATIIGGFIFLGSQVWEWSTFIAGTDGLLSTWGDNATLTSNPYGLDGYGPPQYAQFFFCVTGFHGFHVFSGVVINIIILINSIGGTYERRGHYEMVEKVGLYWHFVDLVWVFVFTFFYLV